jgi:hypothetical protein
MSSHIYNNQHQITIRQKPGNKTLGTDTRISLIHIKSRSQRIYHQDNRFHLMHNNDYYNIYSHLDSQSLHNIHHTYHQDNSSRLMHNNDYRSGSRLQNNILANSACTIRTTSLSENTILEHQNDVAFRHRLPCLKYSLPTFFT